MGFHCLFLVINYKKAKVTGLQMISTKSLCVLNELFVLCCTVHHQNRVHIVINQIMDCGRRSTKLVLNMQAFG
jgi:hypothetical protein